jgi:hypothetical protein
LFSASTISAALALPTCSAISTDPAWGLAGNPELRGLTSQIVPAAGPTPSYCRLDFTYSSLSGPSAGYDVGQSQQIKIRVGLPLNTSDGGSGGVQGNWNGRIRNLGGGGCAGSVGNVATSINGNYVGSSTDTGHTGSCASTFFLSSGSLNWGVIDDFFHNGVRQQVEWTRRITELYYEMKPLYRYWDGCSTGGRQGLELASSVPDELDGVLAGAPAIYWDRLEMAQLFPQIVMKDLVGAPIAPNKKTAATAAAIGACDARDGVVDGVLEDPTQCTFSATASICGALTAPAPPDCLTPQEANAIDKIWDGPRNSLGKRVYWGLSKDQPLNGFAGANPFALATDALKFHHADPSFDWHTITLETWAAEQQLGSNLMGDRINNDNADFTKFRDHGGKMITWQGTADSAIYYQQSMDLYRRGAALVGGYSDTQPWWRYYRAPGVGHCGGGAGPQPQDLFNVLVKWVENGVAPDRILSQGGAGTPTRTRPLCPYPQRAVYSGRGSTDDWNNFICSGNIETPAFNAQHLIQAKYKLETQ